MRRRRGQERRPEKKTRDYPDANPIRLATGGIMERERNQIEDRGHGEIVDHQSRSGIIRGNQLQDWDHEMQRNGNHWQKKTKHLACVSGMSLVNCNIHACSFRFSSSMYLHMYRCTFAFWGVHCHPVDKGQHRGRESFPCVTGNSKGDHYQVGPHL